MRQERPVSEDVRVMCKMNSTFLDSSIVTGVQLLLQQTKHEGFSGHVLGLYNLARLFAEK